MNNVWVPKSCGHNYKSAEEYGTVVFLMDDSQSPFQVNRIRNTIRIALQDSKPEDFIIPTGPPILNVLLALEWPHPRMKMLIYHTKARKYILREVDNVIG